VAKDADWSVIVSEHSGETNETFIVDLAVGVGADYVKFGPPNRGERVAKYNRLIEINEEIQPE
jgi:enolase